MHRVPFLTAPPSIAIADEPLDIGAAVDPLACTDAFELVPAWQARPARGRRRRVLAAVPAIAVAAAVAVSVGPGRDAAPLRPGPVRATSPVRPALVVYASAAPATDVSGAR